MLLRCCLRDISYDWQSEGSRGHYLYDALLASGEPEYYERAIIEKSLSRCSDGLFYQLSAILYRFADDGSEDAKEALHFCYLYTKLSYHSFFRKKRAISMGASCSHFLVSIKSLCFTSSLYCNWKFYIYFCCF